MVSERNRILALKEYFETLGIVVNINKNKARGNKGFFKGHESGIYRIDISKDLPEEVVLAVMLHEFAHYVHFRADKTLKTLDFIFDNFNDEIEEELLKITVREVPKEFAEKLYFKKDELKFQIKSLSASIKAIYPEFKISIPFKPIEKTFKLPEKYLLNYDRVKVFNTIYSVGSLTTEHFSNEQIAYIKLKSKQRALSRVNSRISKLNRYYSSYTELLARFCELYFLKPKECQKLAPKAYEIMQNAIAINKIPEFKKVATLI